MKRIQVTSLAGILLIAVGGLLLLQNLLGLRFLWGLVWAVLFVLSGAVFLYVYLGDRERWWTLIPGFALLAIGALIGLEEILPGGMGDIGGSIVLGGISLGFWAIYLARRDYWWAVIPGGTLLTLAGAVAFSDLIEGDLFAGVFFLGLALTFGIVYLLPTPEGRMTWALIPAGILAVLALFLIAAQTSLLGFFMPGLVILLGLAIILRTFRRR
jgi:hypothetical protein